MKSHEGITPGRAESWNQRPLERFSEFTTWKAPVGLELESSLARSHKHSRHRLFFIIVVSFENVQKGVKRKKWRLFLSLYSWDSISRFQLTSNIGLRNLQLESGLCLPLHSHAVERAFICSLICMFKFTFIVMGKYFL